MAERAEVGEPPAAVAVPRAARLAQRPQAHSAVRQDGGVVELRRVNLFQQTQPRHLQQKQGHFAAFCFFEANSSPISFTYAGSDVVESETLQEIDVALEPREHGVGVEHQAPHPVAKNDVHGDRTLQVAGIRHL